MTGIAIYIEGGGDGHIGLQVMANSAGIWVLNDLGKVGEDGAFLK